MNVRNTDQCFFQACIPMGSRAFSAVSPDQGRMTGMLPRLPLLPGLLLLLVVPLMVGKNQEEPYPVVTCGDQVTKEEPALSC